MLKPITQTKEKQPSSAKQTLYIPRFFSSFSKTIVPYFLSFSLIASPFYLPLQAQATTMTSSNQIYTFDYEFSSNVPDIQLYNVFAGNVGGNFQGETNIGATLALYNTNVEVNNAISSYNTLYVQGNASLSPDTEIASSSSNTYYSVDPAAAKIAIYGLNLNATAIGNTVYMSNEGNNPTYGTTVNIGRPAYVGSLYGAYIGINVGYLTTGTGITNTDQDPPSTPDEVGYKESTVGTVTANNNSIVMTGGIVGGGLDITQTGISYTSAGNYLAAAYVHSLNTNADAQFLLNNNSVYISGGTVENNIGGKSFTDGSLTGAYVNTVLGNATMSNNSVTITGGEIKATNITGATFYTPEFSSETLKTKVDAKINDSSLPYYGFYYSKASATMFNNSVNISSVGQFELYSIAGAYAQVTNTANLYNNTVSIAGGTFIGNTDADEVQQSHIAGAFIQAIPMKEIADNGDIIRPGGIVDVKAQNNSVTITGGNISTHVAGAIIWTGNLGELKSDLEYKSTISHNTVNIYGGTINAVESADYSGAYNGIYGGIVQGLDITQTNGIKATNTYSITNNIVNIGFDAIINDSNLSIGGGAYSEDSKVDLVYFDLKPNKNTYDGNTFHLNQIKNPLAVGTMANFENYQFTLGAENNAGDTLITLNNLYLGNGSATAAAGETQATKYASVVVNTTLDNTMKIGDEIILLKADTNIDGTLANIGQVAGTYGTFLSQTWDITQTGNNITASLIGNTRANEQSKVLGEVGLSSLASLNNQGDLLSGTTIPSARENVQNAQSQGNGASGAAFVGASAGSSRYNTGSHVDVNSFNISAGIAYGGQAERGDWLVGAFIEYGDGDYSTYNSFSNASSVRGDGTTRSMGGGIFSRFDLDLNSKFSPYAEASLRGGALDNEFSTSDLNAGALQNSGVKYDTHNRYVGTHFTLGNIYAVNNKLSFDTSLSYYWTHQDSTSLNIAGHNVKNDSVNSHRARLNARTNYKLLEKEKSNMTTYGALGYEYELDGKARTYVDGHKSPVPNLKGGTGIGELGVNFQGNTPFSVNLGVQGYAGLREGVSGNMQFMYKF